MGLLHKNLILAGIASVAMVGFLSSSNASAIDGFSFSDVINNYRNQTEQLQSYLTNPFGSGCEATNPDSTISCNETPFPNLLYSASSKENLWGHDGKGIVFVNNDNLINGNPQLATANRGDKLKFSIAIEAENYYDDEKTDPIARYMFGSLNSCGLAVDRSSAIVKVNNQVVSADAYNVELYDIPKEEAEQAGYDFCNEFIISLDWVNESDTPLYAEGSTIEFTYEATIEDDAPSEVFGRGVYVYTSKAGQEGYSSADFMTNTTFQAKALLDGNILIRRVDADGNPVSGAKYVIDGVKASYNPLQASYEYNVSGNLSEFTTNENGEVLILNVPVGEYSVLEKSASAGDPLDKRITKTVSPTNAHEYTYPTTRLKFMLFGGIDVSRAVTVYDDKSMSMRLPGEDEESIPLTYDSSTGEYSADDGYATIQLKKNGDKYDAIAKYKFYEGEKNLSFTYDEATGTYVSKVGIIDFTGARYKAEIRHNEDDSLDFSYGGVEVSGAARDVETGCYPLPVQNNEQANYRLCEDGEDWRMLFTEGVSDDYGEANVHIPFHKEIVEGEENYYIDYPYVILGLREVDGVPTTMAAEYLLNYSETFGVYLVGGFAGLGQMEIKKEQVPTKTIATEFLFRSKEDKVAPENIPNPQTGDAAIKTIIIAVAGLAPIIFIRKRLTRR